MPDGESTPPPPDGTPEESLESRATHSVREARRVMHTTLQRAVLALAAFSLFAAMGVLISGPAGLGVKLDPIFATMLKALAAAGGGLSFTLLISSLFRATLNVLEHAPEDLFVGRGRVKRLRLTGAAIARRRRVRSLGFDMTALSEDRRKQVADLKALGVERMFADLRTRLNAQGRHQRFRANFNLTVGLFFSVGGFGVLGYLVFFTRDAEKFAWPQLVAHFLPRIAAVVAIQVFGYFFLDLYRRGLDEVKYFENELTNVELRHVALSGALMDKDNGVLADVVRTLAATDRNLSAGRKHAGSKSPSVDLDVASLSKAVTDAVLKVVKPTG